MLQTLTRVQSWLKVFLYTDLGKKARVRDRCIDLEVEGGVRWFTCRDWTWIERKKGIESREEEEARYNYLLLLQIGFCLRKLQK
ncbi:hypothetical protein L6452_12806 [Arctium lappa]|uniref:Uncharacterized protein n=1 Tax=Arctium lappa TaxID=4217 RepID=A0ACB9CGI2_ARCLA|nr:hypothetical protein L6452_12806 [Arctium lappa]